MSSVKNQNVLHLRGASSSDFMLSRIKEILASQIVICCSRLSFVQISNVSFLTDVLVKPHNLQRPCISNQVCTTGTP